METGVNYELRDDVAYVTINNPERRNAISFANLQTMGEIFESVSPATARALVLTGAGDAIFSAGVDLSDVATTTGATENPLMALCDKLVRVPIPTIARINGKVVGGGAEISLSCDFRVGVETATLMVPAARIGLHYELEGLKRAAGVVGIQGARRIYMLGRTFNADELTAMGYFDETTSADNLDQTIDAMVERLRNSAPLAVNGMKLTLAEMARGVVDEATVRARVSASWDSEDIKEGLASFREKRPPVYKGR